MIKKYYQSIDETIFEHQFKNQLKIVIVPKPGFAKTEVNLAVRFGSLDQKILLKNQKEPKEYPLGIAHFIEHLLFESDEFNPTQAFARIGASVNAYTTYDRTNYYFSTTNGATEGIRLLIDMVFSPKFTKKSVAKEAKIICQEISMYDDDYEQRIYVDFLRNMYEKHPITHDIAGTVESVTNTTYDTIKAAYHTFYHPSNMVMVIVGDVDSENLITFIESLLDQYEYSTNDIEKRILVEDKIVISPDLKIIRQEVAVPMLMMGLRLNVGDVTSAFEQTLNDVKLSFLLSGVFGKGAKPYHQLMKKRLINDSFDFFESFESSYGHIIVFTETKYVEETKNALSEAFKNMITNDPDKQQFYLAKRKIIGEYLSIFNNISHLANSYLDYFIKGINMIEFYESLESLSYQDILDIRNLINFETVMTLVYIPKDDK